MRFLFSEEQRMVAETVRDLLEDSCGSSALRRMLAQGRSFDAARWDRLRQLGLFGALAPEAAGGLGLDERDLVLVAEQAGYSALPEPLVEHAGIALPALANLLPADDEMLAAAIAAMRPIAVWHSGGPHVTAAEDCAFLLAFEPARTRIVPRERFTLRRRPGIDPLRPLFHVDLDAGAGATLAEGETAARDWRLAFDRGALFSAAQLLGLGQRCLDLAVAYAKERMQFGKPIGSNQAVKHLLADVQGKLDFARPVVYAASAGVADESTFSRARISHARLAAAAAADLAARTAIQVHGAMGYSWEVDVHIFLKRAMSLANAWGTEREHAARIASRIAEQAIGPETTFAGA